MNDIIILISSVLAVVVVVLIFRPRAKKKPASVAPERSPQEQIWAERRRQAAEREAENNQPYEADEISLSIDEASIIEFHYQIREASYAAAYMLTERIALPTSSLTGQALFDRYWDMRREARWSWRDDSQRADVAGANLAHVAHVRAQTMRDALTEAGWRVIGHDTYNEDLKVTYLRRY